MKHKICLVFTIAAFVSLFVSVVEAQGNASVDAGLTPVKEQEDSLSSKSESAPQPAADRKSEASSSNFGQNRMSSPVKNTNTAEGVPENSAEERRVGEDSGVRGQEDH